MSTIRHEIRQISDENRGHPIISQAVVHGNVAYLAGITPNPIVGDIKTQTAQVLRRVDELLKLAGTDKSQLLSAQIWIADMRIRRSQFCLERVGRSDKPSGAGLPHDRLLATWDAC
jgi:enamine deaminase RidA (YjgF/YER057c/UK114 family)